MSAAPISDELIKAYGDTDYVVLNTAPFTLKIGKRSPELQEIYERHRVRSAAFLTAWNPYSQLRAADENARRNEELADELKRRGLKALPAVGRDPSGKWAGEESFLVLGIAPEIASTLGIQFEQNGYLWCGADAIPELVLLRETAA
ncbi:MAG: DUF3293 domain-containing protein [Beijerinckiaceae bacterium]